MLIRTANQQFLIRQVGGYRAFVERECMARWNVRPRWEVAGLPVLAWINRSDWVADCDICRESIVVEPGEGFFCPNCLNVRNAGYARPVVWPDQPTRARIEQILLMRAVPQSRNWLPHETIKDLVAENILHGEGV